VAPAISNLGAEWNFLDGKSTRRLWLQDTVAAEPLVCLHDPRMNAARQWISAERMATRGNFQPFAENGMTGSFSGLEKCLCTESCPWILMRRF
jgi:hypothetical protein